MKRISLFKKPEDQLDPDDLKYMNVVDAALIQRGSKVAYILSFVLVSLFCIFIVWSCNSTRKEVTRGEGQIIPSLGVQPVQSPDGGVINKIHVRENQVVKTGEVLVEMSNVEVVTGYQDLLNKQVEYRLALKRLDAEASGDELRFNEEEKIAYPDAVRDQIRLFEARREKYEGEGREIEANLSEKRSAVQEYLAQMRQSETNLLLLKEQFRRVTPLVRQKLYAEIDYLNLQQRIATAEGDLKNIAETLARTRIEVQEEETKQSNRKTIWDTTIAEESNEYRRQLDSVEEKLKAGSHAVKSTSLRAPMPGVVRRVLLKEGNVAQRAETILELLPTEDILEVEAKFSPPSRGFLEIGQNATISITAFDSSIYGSLDGQVTSISPDTIEDSQGQPWYIVRLRTNTSKLIYEGEDLEIKAGMTVAVDVISGEKTVFDYLLKPILKSRQKGKAGIRNSPYQQTNGTSMPEQEQQPESGQNVEPGAGS